MTHPGIDYSLYKDTGKEQNKTYGYITVGEIASLIHVIKLMCKYLVVYKDIVNNYLVMF